MLIVSEKVYDKIALIWVNKITKEKTGKEQEKFRMWRDCVDQIFNLTMITENISKSGKV